MKPYQLLVLLFLIPLITFANERVEGDINCDGKTDVATIYNKNKKVNVVVTLNSGKKANVLTFGLGDAIYQSSLCGNKASLSADSLDDLSDMLGKNPDGYKTSKTCVGLDLSGGECDSIHIYWNHKTNQLNWWRL